MAGYYQYAGTGKSESGGDRLPDPDRPIGSDRGSEVVTYIDFTAEGGAYYRVYVDGNEVSKHTTQHTAQESAAYHKWQYPDLDVWYEFPRSRLVAKTSVIVFPAPLSTATLTGQQGTASSGNLSVRYGVSQALSSTALTGETAPLGVLTGGSYTQPIVLSGMAATLGLIQAITDQDAAPVIISTPAPSFIQGTASTYDMSQHWTDDGLSTVTSSIQGTLPTGVSYNGTSHILTYDGVAPVDTTTGHTLTVQDAVGSDVSLTFSVVVQEATAFWSIPLQTDEQAFYNNVANWAWTASDKTPEFAAAYAGPTSTGEYIHDDYEADDLWNHYQQYLRTGNSLHLTWAQGWRDYFVNHYQADLESVRGCASSFSYDHMFGQGLLLWDQYQNDSAAVSAAESLGAAIETFYVSETPGSYSMSTYGVRSGARHLTVATYLAEGTGTQRWIDLRDRLLDFWMQSGDFENGLFGGNYFNGSWSTDQILGAGNYALGYRIQGSFQWGLLAEAFWRAYLTTDRTDLRDRLIDFARYTEYYAHDPTYVNPMVTRYYGHGPDLERYHMEADSGDTGISTSDPVYDLSQVNILTFGYKLTGKRSMLDLAQTMLRQGTKYPAGNVGGDAAHVADNEVHHYMDTLTDSSNYLFDYNKGELQYTYQLFESSGEPSLVSVSDIATLADSMAAGEWAELTTTGLDELYEPGGASKQIMTFANGGPCWDSETQKIYFVGGDHNSPTGSHWVIYDAATNSWSEATLPPGWEGSPPTQNHYYCYQSVNEEGRLWHVYKKRYNIDTDTWLSDIPSSGVFVSRGDVAYQYFDGLGYVEVADGTVSLYPDGGPWRYPGTGLTDWGLHLFALYNKTTDTLIFGGGDSGVVGTLYKMDANESITALGTPPSLVQHIGPNSDLGGSGGGLITYDPVSGKCLHLTPDPYFFEWDTETDVWTQLSNPPSFLAPDIGNNGAFFPIPDYGVNVLIEADTTATAAKMWLYKHTDW